MKCLLSLVIVILLGCVSQTVAQSNTSECPPDKVCLTPTEMKFYLGRDDAVKALETQVKKLNLDIDGDPSAPKSADGSPSPANLGYKGVNQKLAVEFARVSGEYSGFKQGSVRVDAAFDVAIKNTKKKCLPFSLCF